MNWPMSNRNRLLGLNLYLMDIMLLEEFFWNVMKTLFIKHWYIELEESLLL